MSLRDSFTKEYKIVRTLLKSKFFNFIETAFTFMQFYIDISHLFAQWKQVQKYLSK